MFHPRRVGRVPGVTGARVGAGALAVVGLAASSVAVAGPARAAECTSVSVVSARGTFEPQIGSLLQKPVGEQILAALPGQAKYTELEYPAAPNFDTSPTAGVTNLIRLLNDEAEACPGQRYVLLGYSQGAQVVGDSLVAPDKRLVGQDAGELSAAVSANIAAIVLYGNPRFVAGEPFNAGTPEPGVSGDKPRGKGDLAAYATRIRDFCQRRDFVCQEGGGVVPHLAYFTNGSRAEGAEFAVRKVTGS